MTLGVSAAPSTAASGGELGFRPCHVGPIRLLPEQGRLVGRGHGWLGHRGRVPPAHRIGLVIPRRLASATFEHRPIRLGARLPSSGFAPGCWCNGTSLVYCGGGLSSGTSS